jgi:hypothetical protein
MTHFSKIAPDTKPLYYTRHHFGTLVNDSISHGIQNLNLQRGHFSQKVRIFLDAFFKNGT